ncbi:hypothetical protein DFP72DRAFT_1149193 [Ephemerocybe angulata]|uniref:Uncharacterized protein n=1 Tax=Ephemerocybe angulata TaxID=980116 RepID=A0A8H6LZ48_9AGAR|nr:hypothetical protein DFP72DRAFT_1149193 [Tulosesus angulatus]
MTCQMRARDDDEDPRRPSKTPSQWDYGLVKVQRFRAPIHQPSRVCVPVATPLDVVQNLTPTTAPFFEPTGASNPSHLSVHPPLGRRVYGAQLLNVSTDDTTVTPYPKYGSALTIQAMLIFVASPPLLVLVVIIVFLTGILVMGSLRSCRLAPATTSAFLLSPLTPRILDDIATFWWSDTCRTFSPSGLRSFETIPTRKYITDAGRWATPTKCWRWVSCDVELGCNYPGLGDELSVGASTTSRSPDGTSPHELCPFCAHTCVDPPPPYHRSPPYATRPVSPYSNHSTLSLPLPRYGRRLQGVRLHMGAFHGDTQQNDLPRSQTRNIRDSHPPASESLSMNEVHASVPWEPRCGSPQWPHPRLAYLSPVILVQSFTPTPSPIQRSGDIAWIRCPALARVVMMGTFLIVPGKGYKALRRLPLSIAVFSSPGRTFPTYSHRREGRWLPPLCQSIPSATSLGRRLSYPSRVPRSCEQLRRTWRLPRRCSFPDDHWEEGLRGCDFSLGMTSSVFTLVDALPFNRPRPWPGPRPAYFKSPFILARRSLSRIQCFGRSATLDPGSIRESLGPSLIGIEAHEAFDCPLLDQCALALIRMGLIALHV